MNNQSLPAHLRKSLLDYGADFLFCFGSIIVGVIMAVLFALFDPKLAYITARNYVKPGSPFTWQGQVVFFVCTFVSVYILMGVSRCLSLIVGVPIKEHVMWLDWWWVMIGKLFT